MTAQSHTFDTRALLPWLVAQQRRVLGILDGLDDHTLRQPVLPSGWSCAGMVQHLTLTTRFWFLEVMGGHRIDPPEDDDFHVSDTRPASTIVDAYQHQAQGAMALVSDLPLNTPPAWWPDDMFGDWRLDNLFEVLLHVLIETTCHAGHLDAARELIDGRTWDYAHGRLTDPR
jgi:uncharacterized damage-inducible protein DinB